MHDAAPSETLFVRFGTTSPKWYLRQDSDALSLYDVDGAVASSIHLSSEQAALIRGLSGTTQRLELDVRLDDAPVRLLLVGRRTDVAQWQGFASDFTDTSAVATALEHGLSFAEKVVSEVNSLVVIIDSSGKIKRFNKLAEELTGMREADLVGRNAHDLFMPESEHSDSRSNISKFFQSGSSWEVVRPIRLRSGIRQIHWRNKLVQGGAEDGNYLVCSGIDITEEREAKQKLIEMANTDTLTGLPNRHAVQREINQLAEEAGEGFAVLFVDLDNFKQVNDHYGHLKGDQLIRQAAAAVQEVLREGDTLARLGGDELLVISRGAGAPQAAAVANRIVERMRQPFQLDLVELYSGCSIGAALYPEHGRDFNELVRCADTAMYAAKAAGKGTFKLFDEEMNKQVSEYVWLDNNLRKALEGNQLQLYYQPKLCLRSGRVVGMEALLRWNHPERGLVAPLAFIPYAEESGLVQSIGAWVLGEAARQASAWRDRGLDLRVAVNVSARQLATPKVVAAFEEALRLAGQTESLVDIELTESCLAHDEELALSLINHFKALGAKIHLDDFGTGYSSLSQLVRLPVDVLKMDRSFVRNVCEDARAQALVRSVLAVAQELGCELVAEGVETQEQARFLRELGVAQAQGYLYAKPLPADEIECWLQSHRQLRRVA